ncbi:Transcription factor fungi [Macrophomina phaseolina MS6]|uniref:Transcription factor fungi n=1 Tax=Macrophomina phaseolina (strain MS6) TaxID=1126212 RepID=K2SQ41_MACPH|nr:Transcription factor fungi [Macrophomina phaseolina MS6]
MLGLGLPAPSAGADASLAGYHLVTRCRTLLATSSLELDPSLADVQCHVLMSLFLINAGHLKPAYSLLGSAVRMAYSLHLHRPVSGDNADLCSRTWWTLVQLDHRCSSLLRRPVAFHWSEISCPLPREDPAWSYHTYAVRLTAAILSGTHGSGRKLAPGPEGALALVEAQAKMLAETLGPVRDWDRSLQESEPFSTLNLDPDTAIAQSGHTDGISTISDSGTVRALQRTLLKVHYHNSLMTLYRAYIRFPFRSLTPVRSPRVDVNATMAVKHAIALTATVFDSFHVDDLLYGICEVYHAQWNAVLTMAGFILSYPLCRYSRLARQHFPKAIAVFDTVAGRIATVGRLAVVGRDLCDRVDRLVRLAEESQKAKEISEAGPSAPHRVEGAAAYSGGDAPGMASSVALNAIGSPFVTPDARGDLTNHPSLPLLDEQSQHIAIQDNMAAPNGALPAVEQDLWSWMDIVGLPSWPDYQHGIDELFTDITDLDVLMDGSCEGFDA